MVDYEVSRRVTTTADVATVTALIEDLHRWTAWSPWEGADPDLQRSYDGPAAGPGARYAWSGNRKAGAGEMEIIEQTPDRIEVALRFSRPMKSQATVTFHLTDTGAGTEIVWSMTGRRTVGVRAMGVIGGMDRIVGPDFERGLARLAAVAEQNGIER